jgi:CBS domain-containing protein
MKLKNVCTIDVAFCTGESSISEAARRMRERHVGSLVVVENEDDGTLPIGIITDRDIVVDVLGRNLDPHTTKVASVMSSPIVVADESEDVSEAIQRMQVHGVRRVVITGAHGALAGIFTLDDLLRLNAEQAAVPLTVLAKEQSREHRGRRG